MELIKSLQGDSMVWLAIICCEKKNRFSRLVQTVERYLFWLRGLWISRQEQGTIEFPFFFSLKRDTFLVNAFRKTFLAKYCNGFLRDHTKFG